MLNRNASRAPSLLLTLPNNTEDDNTRHQLDVARICAEAHAVILAKVSALSKDDTSDVKFEALLNLSSRVASVYYYAPIEIAQQLLDEAHSL